ncbi:MAG: glycosyltransferase [Propionibacteriaceae bacterium]|jgi:glycosyltransferase involved in cell wall biosynthesis|nr:glycosyltransferase [Propionibacteriaceae bacterium]
MIDVMIPFWGDPDRLMAAIDSVRAQTDPNWRLTVVDDCYPIPVGERVAALGDERVRYLRNETNLGITDNYRRCFSLSQADHIVFFGCDDIMLPGFLATVRAAAAAHPQADIIETQADVIDQTDRVVTTLRDTVKARLVRPRATAPLLMAGEAAAANLLRGNWLYWPSLVFHRRVLENHDFRDDFPIVQDLALVVDIIADGGSLLYLPEVQFRYRRHSASASSTSLIDGRRFSGDRRYFALAEGLMRAKGWPRAARAARWRVLSRLDAAAQLPAALKTRQGAGLKVVLRHIFGPTAE